MPNFFIIGAPKCGTTSLANWLAEHPQVFFSSKKEPHFFSEELDAGQSYRSYEKLFRNAKAEHLAVGEGSTSYLYSSKAVPRILEYAPDAKFIVCLRNPVELVHAWHAQLVNDGLENETDFETAWRLQSSRKAGKNIPASARGKPHRLYYADQCMLGSLLEQVYQHVPNDRVLPILLDDMKQDAGAAYRQCLSFLGLRDDGRSAFPVRNAAQKARNPWLARSMRLAAELKKKAGIRRSLGVASAVAQRNVVPQSREPISDDMHAELVAWFRDDIDKLQALLGRDLSHWVDDVPRRTGT